jgi:hypothetical protein
MVCINQERGRTGRTIHLLGLVVRAVVAQVLVAVDLPAAVVELVIQLRLMATVVLAAIRQ